jgi:hypothetical protein
MSVSQPLKKTRKKNDKPWITPAIRTSIAEKDRLYTLSLKCPNAYTREKYRSFRNRLTSVIRVCEKSYASDQISLYTTSLKKQWEVINCLIERRGKRNLPHSMIFPDSPDDNVSAPDLIASKLNEFFVNSGSLAIGNNTPSATDPLTFLPSHDSLHSMFASPGTRPELLKIMTDLKDSAAGIDGVKPKAIKAAKLELLSPLFHLVNLSLKNGVFPDGLKRAVITPVFKKGRINLASNYRPISILNVVSKILEKVMYKRLISFLSVTNILSDKQFGFRKGYSTEMAVTEAISTITKNLNNRSRTININMDLSKAFDTIDHAILCSKLSRYGVKGRCLDWLSSYLSNRTQQVRYLNALSPSRPIIRGVPQGSNLGPLLFLIYVNDIHNVSDACELVMYADDCNVFFSFDRSVPLPQVTEQVNSSLALISDWFSSNFLALNVSKTNYLVFNGRKQVSIPGIAINNSPLSQVSQANFLGILVDDRLSWRPHIDLTNSKLSRSIGVLRKVSNFFSKKNFDSVILFLHSSLP